LPRVGACGMSLRTGATEGHATSICLPHRWHSEGPDLCCVLFESQDLSRSLLSLCAGPTAARRVALAIGKAPMAKPVTHAAAVAKAWKCL